MRWRKTLFLFVGIPLLAYAAVQGLLWLTVKNHADELKRSLSPLANFEYDRIHALPWSPIGIGKITISPHAFDDTITIGSIVTRVDDPIELYDLLRASFQDKMPPRFNVAVNRIELPLGGELAKLAGMQATSQHGPTATFACADRSHFDSNDLQAMGYDRVTTDLRLGFRADRRTQKTNLFARIKVRDMMNFSVEARVPNRDLPQNLPAALPALPKLHGLRIAIEDDSYTRRKNTYCASLSGVSIDEYMDRHIRSVTQFLEAMDFFPSDELVTTYRRFMGEPSQIEISLNPFEPIDVVQTAFLSPTEIMAAIGLELTVNGQPVADLGQWRQRPIEQTLVEDEKAVITMDSYKPTPVAELRLHPNRRVKIRTSDGKQHHAYLDRVESGKAVLTRHLAGGQASFSVPLTTIREALVLY